MIPINNLKVMDLSITAENCRWKEEINLGDIRSESCWSFAIITTTSGHTFTV